MAAISSPHHQQPQRISYILAFIVLIVSFQTLRSIYNRRQSRMINYTNIASASMNIPKIGLGTLGISPSEARPVIVSLSISVLYIPLLVCQRCPLTTFTKYKYIHRMKHYRQGIDYSIVHRFTSMKKRLVMHSMKQRVVYHERMSLLRPSLRAHSTTLNTQK